MRIQDIKRIAGEGKSGEELPRWAWPGGYPMFYVALEDGTVYCPSCANQEDAAPEITAGDVNWEDPELYCDGCGSRIESAYAEDDAAIPAGAVPAAHPRPCIYPQLESSSGCATGPYAGPERAKPAAQGEIMRASSAPARMPRRAGICFAGSVGALPTKPAQGSSGDAMPLELEPIGQTIRGVIPAQTDKQTEREN